MLKKKERDDKNGLWKKYATYAYYLLLIKLKKINTLKGKTKQWKETQQQNDKLNQD